MIRAYGNQRTGRRADLLAYLRAARYCLQRGMTDGARVVLGRYRAEYAEAPASTRRRWKCGR
jgi:hypothetical protein